ncbi:hypothetical protein TIFTF001_005532 [Ficus carica]|uniref:Transmembrane protein n=1 Tax=Ficus carica TaxID=3494 RepID=A0AA88CYR1_FICCA|nr:hypothetical protein TIFTF001_005532 [Ficus carica]
MGWLIREDRSGSSWKLGWTERTLASLTAPPLPLVAIVGIVVVLLSVSSYANYRTQMQRTVIGFRVFLFLLPVVLIFVAHSVTKYGTVLLVRPRTKSEVAVSEGGGGSPWGVAVLLVVVLVLISYRSYFQSKWWPPIWGSYY